MHHFLAPWIVAAASQHVTSVAVAAGEASSQPRLGPSAGGTPTVRPFQVSAAKFKWLGLSPHHRKQEVFAAWLPTQGGLQDGGLSWGETVLERER